MHRLRSLAAGWFLSTTLFAATPQCLQDFAALVFGAPTNSLELLGGTYDQLLDRLGGELSEETLGRILARKDPFHIPEQDNADLSSLRKRLTDLKDMVKTWDESTVNVTLLDVVQVRLKRMKQAGGEREKAQTSTGKDEVIHFESAHDFFISPDGRYALAKNGNQQSRPDGSWAEFLQVHDLKSGQTYFAEGPSQGMHDPMMTADGKAIVFNDQPGTLRVVPFHEGKLDWNNAQSIGEPLKGDQWNWRTFIDSTGKQVYSTVRETNLLYRFDLNDKKRVPLTWEDGDKVVLPTEQRWGAVPGGEEFFRIIPDGPNTRLQQYRVAADGKVTETKKSVVPNQKIGQVTWNAAGTRAYAFVFAQPHLYETEPGKPAVNLLPELARVNASGDIFDVAIDPRNGDTLVLVRVAQGDFRLVRLNGEPARAQKALELKGHHVKLKTTPDGKQWVLPTTSYQLKIIQAENRD